MTTESMSIHRALVELKTIDSRIIKKIDSAKFCVAACKAMGEPIPSFITHKNTKQDAA